MFAHPNFNLEAYFVAQALDHQYLMDDDTSPLMITESYTVMEVASNTVEIPLKSVQDDSVSVFTA